MIRTLGDKTPKVAETAWISEFAYVVGDVEIGEYSSIAGGGRSAAPVHAKDDETRSRFFWLTHSFCYRSLFLTHLLCSHQLAVYSRYLAPLLWT